MTGPDTAAPGRVTIPAELAADVAARPEAYRPAVEDGAEVIGFRWRDDPAREFAIGAASLRPGQPWLDVRLPPGQGVHLTCAAWALVGSVDGGPRPDVGDRVLVLECPEPRNRSNHLASVGEVWHVNTDGKPTVTVRHGQCTPTRWVILPPAPAADPQRPEVRQDSWVRVLACTCIGTPHQGMVGRADHDNPDMDGPHGLLTVEFPTYDTGPCDTTAWEAADEPPQGVADGQGNGGIDYADTLPALPVDAPAPEVSYGFGGRYALWRGRLYRAPLDAIREYRANTPTSAQPTASWLDDLYGIADQMRCAGTRTGGNCTGHHEEAETGIGAPLFAIGRCEMANRITGRIDGLRAGINLPTPEGPVSSG